MRCLAATRSERRVRFSKGLCRETSCRFAHSADELRQAPDLMKTAMCRWGAATKTPTSSGARCILVFSSRILLMLKRMWKHELCLKCLTIMAPAILAQALLLGSLNPTLWKKIEGNNFRTNPEQAMASSATSATFFELIEDQALTAEEVEMASQEAQEVRTREAAVAAGLVLDEPEAPPSASATDVMNDLSSALERLRVAFSTPTPGLGASGPAEDEDKEMSDAVTTERASPPTRRLKGFVAASQKTTAPVNKPVSLVPVDGRPGYFKLVDLPDLFPVLPASAATLLRDVTVEEAVSLFHKFVGKNLTEDLVVRILEAYVPMKIQIRQEEVWASQFQRNKDALAPSRCTDSMPPTRTTNSCVRRAVRGGRRQPINAGSARARSLSPSRLARGTCRA